ncbi:VOC family protein [Kineosporia sp. A_224]|uniref:VOC family protein n=1 Tax=Kineosporia sp. A_224 TaxID=1962180 RepID=UPI000B4B061E|nr:VOC family protein [Kineosporia sp. A_224]
MITGLHHYALAVPDLGLADTFLQGFGLETGERSGALVGRCPGRDQDQVRMVEGPTKQLHHLSFSVAPGGLDALRERLERAGVAATDPPAGAPDEGVWVVDPHGTAVQLLETEPAPARAVPDVLHNVGGTYQRFDTPAWRNVDDVLPRRLGHCLVFTPDQAASTAFYVDVLGFAVSDRITGKVTFLNAGPGDHHVFGFITSSHPGFHHASYEVPSIDAIGVGARRLQQTGWAKGWGLGRHTIGSNYFHYTQDPWGSWIEWFSDIDQIRDCWVPNDWDVPPHLWGTPPPEDFLTNREPQR